MVQNTAPRLKLSPLPADQIKDRHVRSSVPPFRTQVSHAEDEPINQHVAQRSNLLNNNPFYLLSSPATATFATDDHSDRSRDSDICNRLLDQLAFTPITPFVKAPINLFSHLNGVTLDNCTSYTHIYKNREVAYYGTFDYSYSGTVHKARDINENSELAKIFTEINSLFPSVGLNSAMINCYRKSDSYIPFHVDDEPEVDKRVPIISISLGQSRSMLFRDKISKETLTSTSVEHGDLLLMSVESQNSFEHSVSSRSDNLVAPDDFRISITFRKIKKPDDTDLPDFTAISGQKSLSKVPNSTQQNGIPDISYESGKKDVPNQRPYSKVLILPKLLPTTESVPLPRNQRTTKIIPPSNYKYNSNKSSRSNFHHKSHRNCLILHDSLLDLFDKDMFYPKARTHLFRTKTLSALNDEGLKRKIRSYAGIDTIIIHLGVNDLKLNPPDKVIQDLKRALLHLSETSSAKIFYSLVLPVGNRLRLNANIKNFNKQAIDLITNLRDQTEINKRVFTIFKDGFIKNDVEAMRNLYNHDLLHLNKDGTAKLCWYFKNALDMVYFPSQKLKTTLTARQRILLPTPSTRTLPIIHY